MCYFAFHALTAKPEDPVVTTHHGHAQEIARTIQLDQCDAVVTVSGDGLIHEVLNGFAEHTESIKALGVPVAPVPTGSGNALSLNLLGIEVLYFSLSFTCTSMNVITQDGFDVVVAALNAIKGL